MNPKYLEVFRSHRILFLLPIALAGAVALWVGLTTPTQYRSSATLWADTAIASPSSQQPAAEAQETLNELLATRHFQGLVAGDSRLAEYLEDHPPDGWGATALLAKLRSTARLDDRIAAALGPDRASSSVVGTHVVKLTYDAPTPRLAKATLDAIVKELIKQRAAFRKDALAAAEKRVTGAAEALSSARKQLRRYLDAHPRGTRNDPRLRALATAERRAATTLADTAEALRTDVTPLLASQTSLRIVDAPQPPSGPRSRRKLLVVALLAGLFAGAVVSVLGIVAVARTRADNRPLAQSGGSVATGPRADRAADPVSAASVLAETRTGPGARPDNVPQNRANVVSRTGPGGENGST